MNKVLVSRKSDDWATPKYIYDEFIKAGWFDPCPFQSDFDGLSISWKPKNFVNPPYSQTSIWVEKAISESRNGKKVVLLIPARTDTKYFRRLYEVGCKFVFITGRLRFNEAGPAPFPSMLVIMGIYSSYMDVCGAPFVGQYAYIQ